MMYCSKRLIHHPVILSLIGAVLGFAGFSVLVPVDNGNCGLIDDSYRMLAEILPQPTPFVLHQSPKQRAIASAKPKFQTPPPEGVMPHTYFAPCGKNCHAMVRAFRILGWIKVNAIDDAMVVVVDVADEGLFQEVQPWQRYNHIHNATAWSLRAHLVDGVKRHQERHGVSQAVASTSYFPHVFRLNREQEREDYAKFVASEEGKKQAWAWIRGKGSARIRSVTKTRSAIDEAITLGASNNKSIMEQHVCDLLTYTDGNTLAIRVFWMVASTDPLLVLYQDGFARVGHVPNFLIGDQGELSFDEFGQFIEKYAQSNRKLRRLYDDPVNHLRNQFKEAIAQFVDMFKDTTFKPSHNMEDAFEVYAFDFVVDRNLDAWLHETYTDTFSSAEHEHRAFMLEDYYFLLEKNHELFYGMTLTLQEVWDKQANGKQLLPLQSTGKFQLIYAGDDWQYEYEGYERPKKKKVCKP